MGLQLRGHAQITRCGTSSGQARYDGRLVELVPAGAVEASRVHAAMAWRQAGHWRPAFGQDIDTGQGAAGALRAALRDLERRVLRRDTAPLWLGLLALDPETYFEWMTDMERLLDLAEMQEAGCTAVGDAPLPSASGQHPQAPGAPGDVAGLKPPDGWKTWSRRVPPEQIRTAGAASGISTTACPTSTAGAGASRPFSARNDATRRGDRDPAASV